MSAFARLAIIHVNRPAHQPPHSDDDSASELESLAQAARAAAPPLPPPVISFAPEKRAAAGWYAKLRAALCL